jgi:hypothetical protein
MNLGQNERGQNERDKMSVGRNDTVSQSKLTYIIIIHIAHFDYTPPIVEVPFRRTYMKDVLDPPPLILQTFWKLLLILSTQNRRNSRSPNVLENPKNP